ncbi:hypothetical protein [Ancylobacter amanitiformis]|uniref:Pyruvate/2-oxoglutarate dehydrogenase complex dihydrolipoamide acyltransferase (E2) component n=1 Tax=Ancylobacter amanitiformis TaxID=217069 RepID=A0ABU0LMR9_9HYPH|nr:hypothetical protein [Ancylobacter amanitiformis]MDQ0509958.1 pyruvate/2-oxoglutarate dehydrogenase complex dihydrolipoamide acyltransferase (E2) component [Ancylobacter amanitiformis]
MMTTFRHTGAAARGASGLIAVAALALVMNIAADGAAMAQGAAPAVPPAGAPSADPPAPAATQAPATPAATADGPYVFTSPPSAQANRVYSVNMRTGEVNACQFERPEGSVIGITKCFPRDASAAGTAAGAYDVMTTRYSGETGIFRVNTQTGQMSVCYVRDMPKEGGGVEPAVVCTPGAR